MKHGENLIEALETAEKLREDYMQYEIELKQYMSLSAKQKENAQVPEKPKSHQLMGKSIAEYILIVLPTFPYFTAFSCVPLVWFVPHTLKVYTSTQVKS